jgi:beta-lactamase class D
MKNLFYVFFVLNVILFSSCNKKTDNPQSKQNGYETDLSKYFEGYSGAFVLYDVENKYYIRHNEEQCKKRLSPCSTFKIPNSLIALETGIATDENFF